MSETDPLRLGVNIDHVATIRNARGGGLPDPVRAAEAAARAGADGITAHLREDRRHIGDGDIERLASGIGLPLNLEMAATEEMLAIALRHKPNACCIVPEKRQEVTTEGGLDVVANGNHLPGIIDPLKKAGIRVSLFIDADAAQIEASAKLGADIIELHTGTYCHAHHDGDEAAFAAELEKLKAGAVLADSLGLEVHAGHGLCFETVAPIAAIPQVVELNIGHFLIGEAIFIGLEEAIAKMRGLMIDARAGENS
ncbi:pyridoxine 5'-phosphate synthase [Alphaproteobacteria bacterium]|nr:pyridoxine 5'-phosphate synthase [Alphaproteobacteria bacterium]MDA8624283.1 pyridoxine 5'-phosphate synthase [Alphaproteobacteria bacterium]MDA8666945.1 pyridoxine 5'-phosphate synthase [Alphaproteobacteria bacterium]MDB2381370.1 pyridoxine 5'-phosphate synthase [Alphaproteobacteria bacterium]MDB2431619.1 pyridoxine 5'-phosphate synthase [Alphaproteobacteria bacterium]